MKEILNYNFDLADLKEGVENLFNERRRDACFAYVFEEGGFFYGVRDHLGTVPLYYRFDSESDKKVRFSLTLSELVRKSDVFDNTGLKFYLSFGTAKIHSLIKGIHIVPPGSIIKINPVNKTSELIYRYEFREEKSLFISKKEIIEQTEKLLKIAIGRVVKFPAVGLYLSGGMDSGLVGIYLKKLGVKIRGYTSLTWGKSGSEAQYANENSKAIGLEKHFIVPLKTNKYSEYSKIILEIFSTPHGTSTSIGVASLWEETGIGKEKQIFCGQNCDNMSCSATPQYLLYFMSIFPQFLRKRIHKTLKYKDLLKNYLSFSSGGLLSECGWLSEHISNIKKRGNILTMAGILVAHTPGEAEVLAGPTFKNDIIFSSPFYDVDLIEFLLRFPLRFRLSFGRDSRIFVKLEKKVFRWIAEKYLSKKLVYRKKGFTVSGQRDEKTRSFYKKLPKEIFGIKLDNPEKQIAGQSLILWAKKEGIKINGK